MVAIWLNVAIFISQEGMDINTNVWGGGGSNGRVG